MANFGNKNETFAYLVGKDIAEIKAKIEGIGTTSGGLDVLKVVVPAATEEQVNNGAVAEVDLPESFQNSLVLSESYGSYNTSSTTTDPFNLATDTIERTYYIIKLTDFKNPKETATARIKTKKVFSGGAASDA
mgnify:CR=1 FL=1|nr:MAG TPA: hypothetical protein [Bacteriophage sp.]